ncbi:MAG: TolC family protein [Bacteroidales bacterium]
MRTMITFFLALCTLSFPALAQSVSRLSLTQAQEYAVSHNYLRRNALLDIESANSKVWETTASGLPQISAQMDFRHNVTSLPTIEFGDQKISTGVKNNLSGNVTLSQLVFSGSYIVGLQASRTYKAISELALEKSDIELSAQTAETYFLVQVANRQYALLSENLTLIEKLLAEARASYQQGLVQGSDVMQLEVNRSLLETECRQASRQASTTLQLLKFVIGMELSDSLILTDPIDALMQTVTPAYLAIERIDPESQIDVKISDIEQKSAQLLLKLKKTEYLPTLSGFVDYQRAFTLPEFAFAKPNTVLAGLSLQMPLFSSGLRNARVRQARNELQKSIHLRDQTVRQTLLTFTRHHDAFHQSYEAWMSQQQNLRVSRKIFDEYSIRYSEGMASSMELTQANNSYLQAVGALIKAQLDLFNAKVGIDKMAL